MRNKLEILKKKLIEEIKRKKNVYPRLAGGVLVLAFALIFMILEKLTGIPFITKYPIIFAVICTIITGIISNKYFKTYDRYSEENDNFLFGIILFILTILVFLVVLFLPQFDWNR